MSGVAYLTAPQFSDEDLRREEESLTEEEKQRALDDLHGKNTGPDETEDLVRVSLKQLQDELDGMDEEVKEEFIEARRRGAELTLEDDELLLFLRSERFDVGAAARRLVTYWNERIELFGRDRGYKPLSATSTIVADDDDRYMSSMNVFRMLPGKDSSGRAIFLYEPSRTKLNYKRNSFVRVVWSICHQVLQAGENKTDVKRGNVVAIIQTRSADVEMFDRKVQKEALTAMREIIPIRLTASHWCHPPAIFKYVFPVFRQLMGRTFRIRSRVHEGTDDEVLQQLAEFGISREVLPRHMGGEVFCPNDVPFVKRDREEDDWGSPFSR